MIKSPYNFVPLNDKVYFPDWADQVSHDVPFSDGESGTITVKMTAESPIFVRNGSKNKDETAFSNDQGKYFIPGTSIKGMIRSVLEIMSFGKMQFVDNRRFTWRDLSPSADYTSNFTENIKARPLVEAGFIEIVNGKWKLIPCKYARIEQCELDSSFGVANDILSAADKYKFWKDVKGENLEQKFLITGPSTSEFKKQCGTHYRAKIDISGDTDGQLVFTGQIGPRIAGGEGQHGKGKKHLEFVFFDKGDEFLDISDTMRKDFELNHSNERNKENHSNALKPNEEWGYWKHSLNNGGKMPVFWLKNTLGKISSFGMSMLFRLPLENSVYDQIKGPHTSHITDGGFIEDKFRADLADCIFGYTVGKKTLKGRVQFTHAFAKGTPKVLQQKSVVLGSPKATFYPNYLKEGTYSAKHGIKGRKRYPIHNAVKTGNNETDNTNIETQFSPLAEGTEFKLNINFHNLKKIELGALLSALTFHNTVGCYHSLGMAKPLGYGKIKINIEPTNLQLQINEYLKEFEKTLNISIYEQSWSKVHKNCWAEPLKELITMASEQNNNVDSILNYMTLEGFVKAKNNRERLKYYSQQSEVNEIEINKYYSDNELSAIFTNFENDKIARKKYAEEKRKFEEEKAKLDAELAKQAEVEARRNIEEKAEKEKQYRDIQGRLEGGLNKALGKNDIGGICSDSEKFVNARKAKLDDNEVRIFIKKVKNLKKSEIDKLKHKKKGKRLVVQLKNVLSENDFNIFIEELNL